MPGRSGGQTPAATKRRQIGKARQQPSHQRPLLVPGSRMHHQAGRLVHHGHVGVGVDHGELHAGFRLDALRLQARAGRWSGWHPRARRVRPTVTTAPSTRTPPAAMSPVATARETLASMATARSTRTPARSGGTSTTSGAVGLAHALEPAGWPKSIDATRTTTPTVMQASATLKVGQWLSVMKSATSP